MVLARPGAAAFPRGAVDKGLPGVPVRRQKAVAGPVTRAMWHTWPQPQGAPRRLASYKCCGAKGHRGEPFRELRPRARDPVPFCP